MQQQHRPFFPLDKAITEESGKALGEWARGGAARPEPKPDTVEPVTLAALQGKIDFATSRAELKAIWSRYLPGLAESDVEAAQAAYKTRHAELPSAAAPATTKEV